MSRERDALLKAMDHAKTQGVPAPCSEDPRAWTHDFYKPLELQYLRELCSGCPVLQECRAYLRADRDRLFGVVAGQDLTWTKKRRLASVGDA